MLLLAVAAPMMIHLPAIAHELGWELKPELFDRINNEIPYSTNIQPSGEYVTEMMWFAGGVPMVQWYLRDYLDLDVLTGSAVRSATTEMLHQSGAYPQPRLPQQYKVSPEAQSVNQKMPPKAGRQVLKGNIALEGAVIKYAPVRRICTTIPVRLGP